jgi:hypothetical protein
MSDDRRVLIEESGAAPRGPGRGWPTWAIIAAALWGGALVALLLRAGIHPRRPTSLSIYLAGGSAWVASQPLYTNWRGFVYPPVVAWFFGLVTRLPLAVAAVLWRALAAGVFLAGLCALLRSGVFHRIGPARRGLVLVAALPLSIGNIDNAQANPLVAGCMMLSVAALEREGWTLCAVAIGIATVLKIYPFALALLLCILRPRQLCWRIALVIALLVALPFALQSPHYVAAQYHAWLATRLADNRFEYPMKDAPLDLWYLLVRLGSLPVSERAYTALQVLAGMALAALVWRRSRRAGAMCDKSDNLAALFLLVSVWMLLLGPATENQTYVVLAPAACLLAVESFTAGNSSPARLMALSAYGLLLAAVMRNSLTPYLKSPLFMAIQPLAALILLPAIYVSPRGSPAAVTPPRPR